MHADTLCTVWLMDFEVMEEKFVGNSNLLSSNTYSMVIILNGNRMERDLLLKHFTYTLVWNNMCVL